MLLSNDVSIPKKVIAIGEEKVSSSVQSTFLQSLVNADPLSQNLLTEGRREEDKAKVKLNLNQAEKYAELYEQKAFAEYKLSYIDPALWESAHENAMLSSGAKFKSDSIDLLDSMHIHAMPADGNKVSAAATSMGYARAEISTLQASAKEVMSVGVLPFRHSHAIDRVRVTLGDNGDDVSLVVRDHFSDEKGLSSLVKRFVKSLNFMVSKVFVNGKAV
jgi:hypothetical protein